jgi:hypothetical protein
MDFVKVKGMDYNLALPLLSECRQVTCLPVASIIASVKWGSPIEFHEIRNLTILYHARQTVSEGNQINNPQIYPASQ